MNFRKTIEMFFEFGRIFENKLSADKGNDTKSFEYSYLAVSSGK